MARLLPAAPPLLLVLLSVTAPASADEPTSAPVIHAPRPGELLPTYRNPYRPPARSIDWHAAEVSGLLLSTLGIASLAIGLGLLETQQGRWSPPWVDATGGLLAGGGAVGGAGLALLLAAARHRRTSALPPRFVPVPMVARTAGGLAFQGAF